MSASSLNPQYILGAQRLVLLLSLFCLVSSATHDELPQCGLSGIYKTRQSVIESPNYPNNYPTNTCWDYVIRSPYRCPTKFHIQFLDFHLESSDNCTNDYLAIGLENDGDDMDLLCGQVIGIKKYHTPDGILRLRFLSDGSPWTTARGFKLLITRLACEREDYLHELLDGNDEDTEELLTPALELKPPQGKLPQLFRNFTQTEQHIPYPTQPLFGWNLPGHVPENLPIQFPILQPPTLGGVYAPLTNGPLSQNVGSNKPCIPEPALGNPYMPYLRYTAVGYRSNDAEQPISTDQYVGVLQSGVQSGQQQAQVPEQKSQADSLAKSVNKAQPRQQYWGGAQFSPPLNSFQSIVSQLSNPQLVGTTRRPSPQADTAVEPAITASPAQKCCTSSFHQKRFYLSSPGFPRTAFTSLLPAQQRECQFVLEKHADNVCRLRIEFKFFDFGQTYVGTGNTQGNINIAISSTKDVCTEDYIEIDGSRFCGCRTGYIYTSPWGLGTKQIRMRMGYSGIPSSGFLLDIYQEECKETAFVKPLRPAQDSILASGVQSGGTQGNAIAEQQNTIGNQNPLNTMPQTLLSQQQLPSYQQPPNFMQTSQAGLPLNQITLRPPHTTNFNPFLAPQQQQQQLWSVQFAPPYTELPQLPPPFGLPMTFYRQARTSDSLASTASTHQPMTVVETNSTRKEYYYFDGDEAFGRLRANDEPDDLDRNGVSPSPSATVRDRCSFSTMDALRLTVDSLWITKPACYAPLRSWFSNIFGG